MATKDIATKATGAELSAVLDFAADAGMGMEGADKNSFAIPFITLLQGLSPQLETVEGAKPGKFINSITNEVYGEVLFVPCSFQRRFIRWAPRANGGGYKGDYSPIDVETGKLPEISLQDGTYMVDVPAGSPARDSKGLPLFDHLADTRNHFCLVQSATGAWQPALISLSSTQIKKSKRLMSRIQGVELRTKEGRAYNPPSFSHVYRAKSQKEENAKGSWWGWEFDIAEPVGNAELYAAAKAFHSSVATGAVEVAQPADEAARESAAF